MRSDIHGMSISSLDGRDGISGPVTQNLVSPKISPPGTSKKVGPPRNIRGRKFSPPGTVRGTAHGRPLLSMVPRPKSVSLLPAVPTGHRGLLPALRGCTFTLANIYHKTMHNPNPTLNYLFLYHETNCDMNHLSYLGLTASAK